MLMMLLDGDMYGKKRSGDLREERLRGEEGEHTNSSSKVMVVGKGFALLYLLTAFTVIVALMPLVC